MFQSFTGSSRKPRQVNLSQRNQNPFAKPDPWGNPPAATAGSQNAIEKAQQDRAVRQQEREKRQAALLIQRSYKGYTVRKAYKADQASRWDSREATTTHASVHTSIDDANIISYQSDNEAFTQLRSLLRFAHHKNPSDLKRIWHYYRRLRKALDAGRVGCSSKPWMKALTMLQSLCLTALREELRPQIQDELVAIIRFTAKQSHFEGYEQATQYYRQVEAALKKGNADLDLITAPLSTISSATTIAYEGLVTILQIAELDSSLQDNGTSLSDLAENVNYRLLGTALRELLDGPLYREFKHDTSLQPAATTRWTSLLAHFIFFYRHAHAFGSPQKYASDPDFVFCVSTLLSGLVDYIEVESSAVGFDEQEKDDGDFAKQTPSPFIRDQIYSLVRQGVSVSMAKGHSRVLATYILTLFRLFPRKGDEIRMWLYLGSSPASSRTDGQGSSVVRYFFEAMHQTQIYVDIIREPRSAIQLLKPDAPVSSRLDAGIANNEKQAEIDDQWRVILIFLELYSFVLKVMDDEEFFASSQSSRKNVLNLNEIKEVSLFLKHLGFTMYYNASDILGTHEEEEQKNLASLFNVSAAEPGNSRPEQRRQAAHVAGIHGTSLEYFKGLVTGVMRAIYERDSRRSFCPQGHWLMVSRFDMTSFIDAVVEEEERRSKVQEEDEEDVDGAMEEVESDAGRLVGTSHAQRLQRMEQLQRQQRKASRKRYLQAVAPRLEILQNMPFLIPFTTRVQIFRRFVHLDKLKRRQGHVDPEVWRMMRNTQADPLDPSSNPLARHHASIRRGHEFEDAFDQYYKLGDLLKEPIQITFYNQFGEAEAGIDGGGVTKEFLTSVTDKVFSSTEGIPLFVENEQRVLYPNPAALEEQKVVIQESSERGVPSPTAPIAEMLQRYEFLGRIIGKCLYESILVDIRFAPFFLLKWALTGGTGSAPNESGYRASLNDIRDLDEGLYQGLLHLKNYTGDLEDLALNFTITDTLKIPALYGMPARERNVTKELMSNGANTAITQANRLVYISYVARHRLSSQPARQTAAFLRGLSAMVQPSWLSMFNQSELQTLVGGAPADIDVADLRRNTAYGGVYLLGDDGLEHATVRMFWETMQDLGDEDRRAVVKFVTSTPRAPLLGFKTLTPPFSIRDSGADTTRLPSTSTCVNLLKLPMYKDKATLKMKLLQAVRSGAGFDLS